MTSPLDLSANGATGMSAEPNQPYSLSGPNVGVLLINLGSPSAPTSGAVRRYLREFLSDRRVIQLNPLLWQPILHGFILPFRPVRTAAKYKSIWREAEDMSPLTYYTSQQAALLSEALSEDDRIGGVSWAMRYGAPDIGSQLTALQEAGCDHILIVPLYPQYSDTTVASVADKVNAEMQSLPKAPQIRTLAPYYKHPRHIVALKTSIEAHVAHMSAAPEVLLLSYHGIPLRYAEKGDPYASQCAQTTTLLQQVLDLPDTEVKMTFQSRFGAQEWLRPYTDETLRELGQNGIKSVLLAAPGFASDCIETLEELDMEGQDIFLSAGGEHYDRVPCLNDSAISITMLKSLVDAELNGWAATDWR